MAAVLLPQIRPAMAQYVTCPAVIDLTTTRLPEIGSSGGRLKGTVALTDAQRAVTISKTTPNGPQTKCLPQLQRFFSNVENQGPIDMNKVTPPIPGPTLRASLGDVVELTFLNQIDPLDYGNSIHVAEDGRATSCDSLTHGSCAPKPPPNPRFPT